jgi:hypothetical protein
VNRQLPSGAYLLKIMRYPEIGFELKAVHEECNGQGCFGCDYKQWRDLTEDEELEAYELEAQCRRVS